MRPKGSAAELQVRRRIAGQLLLEGKGVSEVARLVKASRSAVSGWKKALCQGGMEALNAKPHAGRKARLRWGQKQQLLKILRKGPTRAGFATDLWTCARIAAVIERRFGVSYHVAHIWKILQQLGWSPQKPEQRARERDEAAIARWREVEWPRIKKGRRKSS